MEEPPMQDKTVSLTHVIALALWGLAVALVLIDAATDLDVGQMGLVASAGAATLTIRGYFVELAHRERNAFEIGRDSVRHRRP